MTTVHSNDTLGNTPFQLISDFFHVNWCFEHAEQASSMQGCFGGGATGLLNKGGGSNRLPGLVTKQLTSCGFPQLASLHTNTLAHDTVTN